VTRPVLQRSADVATYQDRRHNFWWAAVNGSLFEFGASFVDTGTVVATFLGRLTPGTMAVGAATAIARFGWLLPQLFAARYAQSVEYRKSIYLVGGWGRALSLAALAAVLLWWTGLADAPGLALMLFLAIWTFFSFIAGLAGASYNDVIARTIPPEWRSRLLATRLFVGGALAAGGGLLIRSILESSPEPLLRPYGLIFGAGTIVLAASTLCFAFIREPPTPVTGRRSSLRTFLREGIDVPELSGGRWGRGRALLAGDGERCWPDAGARARRPITAVLSPSPLCPSYALSSARAASARVSGGSS